MCRVERNVAGWCHGLISVNEGVLIGEGRRGMWWVGVVA
jgi:hypothetical protein